MNKGTYDKINLGTYEVIENGEDIAILAIGNMVEHALKAKEITLKDNINPTIINARFLKPMDENLLHKLCKEHKYIITIEDNVLSGGFGSNINQFVIDNKYDVKINNIGISDKFINQGNIDKLYEEVGLSPEGIALKIKEFSSER